MALLLLIVAVSLLAVRAKLTTVVSAAEIVDGPGCCLFDSPFASIDDGSGTVLGYTSNSESYLIAQGSSINSQLPVPVPIGLGPDSGNTNSYAHCGRWLNSVWRDDNGTVHGYFHQEWRCDYADGDYTNKSVGYAVSYDRGRTFNITPASSGGTQANQLIAGYNTTSSHQTGEGDHGVVRMGDWLYMLFIEWDGDPSVRSTSTGIARSSLQDAGRPGTWWKWYNGSWDSPGVGGPSDIVWAPGTAVYNIPLVQQLIAIGVIFSADMAVSYSADGVQWQPAEAGPLFTSGWSNWNRDINASELYGYPGLAGLTGTNDGLYIDETCYVYFTYLAPGTDFTHRWLGRRALNFYNGTTAWGGAPPSLQSVSLYISNSTSPITWSASGPVPPDVGYALQRHDVLYLITSQQPVPAPQVVQIVECAWTVHSNTSSGTLVLASALTFPSECGSGAFVGAVVLRPAGYAAAAMQDAHSMGWSAVTVPGTGQSISFPVGPVWRCVRSLSYPVGYSQTSVQVEYSVTWDDPTCAGLGQGFEPDAALGYAFGPLVSAAV